MIDSWPDICWRLAEFFVQAIVNGLLSAAMI